MKIGILRVTDVLNPESFNMIGQVLLHNYEKNRGDIIPCYLSWICPNDLASVDYMFHQAQKFLQREFGRYNVAQIKKFAAFNETTWRKWATLEFRQAVDKEIQRQARRRLNACNQRRAILLGKKQRHKQKSVPKEVFSHLLENHRIAA